MNKIKFSEDYEKLPMNWEGTQARLVAVKTIGINYFRFAIPQFLIYDTTYRYKPGRYELDFDDGILLVFIHLNTGKPFTTIRRFYPAKFRYYKSRETQTFTLLRDEK